MNAFAFAAQTATAAAITLGIAIPALVTRVGAALWIDCHGRLAQ
jgi:hypothetical protein